MTVGLLSFASPSAASPLRFVSALGNGPTQSAVVAVASAPTTQILVRAPFIIGSGDVSDMTMSLFGWFLAPSAGITDLGNGFTVNACSIEYNGMSKPVTFAGGRTKTINSGDTDIQSDTLLPSAFGLTKFARDSTGFVRMMATFSTPATDHMPVNAVRGSDVDILYDPTKVIVTNGVDSTGAFAFSMTNGGVDGTDAVFINSFFVPIILGHYVAGDAPAWLAAGDSKTAGVGDTGSSIDAFGITRAFFPSASVASNSISNLNFGCDSGVGSDWQTGPTAQITAYLKYARYAIENYGTNGLTVSFSTAIHSVMRSNGIEHIVRPSLTPRTNSTDDWETETNQTTVSGWSVGGAADLFEQALQTLVAADLTYIETAAVRGSTHFIWIVNGTAFFSTADGLHQSANGYELTVGGTSSVITPSGTAAGTMRGVIAALP
jgi:hypothetical protein